MPTTLDRENRQGGMVKCGQARAKKKPQKGKKGYVRVEKARIRDIIDGNNERGSDSAREVANHMLSNTD